MAEGDVAGPAVLRLMADVTYPELRSPREQGQGTFPVVLVRKCWRQFEDLILRQGRTLGESAVHLTEGCRWKVSGWTTFAAEFMLLARRATLQQQAQVHNHAHPYAHKRCLRLNMYQMIAHRLWRCITDMASKLTRCSMYTPWSMLLRSHTIIRVCSSAQHSCRDVNSGHTATHCPVCHMQASLAKTHHARVCAVQ